MSSTASNSTSLTCLCRSVHLTLKGAVDKGAVLCHCTNCQKFSGSAFAYNHRFLHGELKVTAGEEWVRRYEDGETKTGNVLMRHFCGKCGSPLYLTNPKPFPGLVILPGGTLQDKTAPRFELFGENKCKFIDVKLAGNKTAKL